MAQEKKNTKTHISEQIPSDCVSSIIKGRLPDTVSLGEDDSIIIIDQTKLPLETRLIKLQTQEEIYLAIKTLQVRGAPAIGVTAAFALYLAAKEIIKRTPDISHDIFIAKLKDAKKYLGSSRPTAVNLFWALDKMLNTALESPNIPDAIENMKKEAVLIRDNDIASCRKIGENGLKLLRPGDGILTHCNAGQLAAVRYGTALSPIYLGHEQGYGFHVYTDETRPLLQGMRLSAFELSSAGIDTTVICDSMVSAVMKSGKINAVIVGADRIAANGDTANKIGTSGVAVIAKYYGIPFYVAAPKSTFDPSAPTGNDITIEERDATEIGELWFEKPLMPRHAKTYNPAFDITDHTLITGFITDD